MICERSAEQRSYSTRHSKDTPKAAKKQWSIFKLGDLRDDTQNSHEQPSSSNTGHSTSKDQEVDVPCYGTKERAEFEEENSDEENVFCGDDGEELAEGENEACLSQEIS